MPGGRESMLRRCLDVTPTCERDADEILLRVEIVAQDVGHFVPTGFVDHHVILVVDAQDANGQRIELQSGPRLPAAAGDLMDQSGVLFAKLLTDANGDSPVPFWRAGVTVDDNRLQPETPRTISFRLPSEAHVVRLRLLYRRFWQSTAEDKGWPDPTLVIVDRTWTVGELLP